MVENFIIPLTRPAFYRTGLISLLLLILFFPFNSCDVAQQTQQVINLTKCDFRILTVQDITLAGVKVQNIQSVKDLDFSDMQKLMLAVAGSDFNLAMQLNVEGRNPNTSAAGLNKLDWILFIDDIQMTEGSVTQAFTIPPNNGTAVIPIAFGVDLKKVLQGKSLNAILNFGFNLAGTGNKPTRIMIKLKPTIMIGKNLITYPGYISVRTEFTSL
jgi:LEA14-like dessication related protein